MPIINTPASDFKIINWPYADTFTFMYGAMRDAPLAANNNGVF